MNKNIIMLLFSLFVGLTACAGNQKDKQFVTLFANAEKNAIKQRKEFDKKGVFMDPLGINSCTYNILKKTSPELLDNTNVYIDSLLSLFNNKLIPRDYYTDFDIIVILSNLCIDDYIIVINKVYLLYTNKKIKFKMIIRI
jgi:hypothetical protein